MYDFFISFKCTCEGARTRDAQIARELYQELTDHGASVFFSDEELQKNGIARYMQEISVALKEAQVFILVLGDPAFAKKGWVAQEWSSFVNLMMSDPEKKFFSLLIDVRENELPALLGPFQSFQYRDGLHGTVQYLLKASDRQKDGSGEGIISKCIDAQFALSGWKNEGYLLQHAPRLQEQYPEMIGYLMALHHLDQQSYRQAKAYIEDLFEQRSVLGAHLYSYILKKGKGVTSSLQRAKEVSRVGLSYWREFRAEHSRRGADILLLVYEKLNGSLTAAEYMAAAICRVMSYYELPCEIAGLFELDAEALAKSLEGRRQVMLVTDELNCFTQEGGREAAILDRLSGMDRNVLSLGIQSMRVVNIPKSFRRFSVYELHRHGIDRYCRRLLQLKLRAAGEEQERRDADGAGESLSV